MNTTVVIVCYKSEHLIEKNIDRFDNKANIIIIDNSNDKTLRNIIDGKYKNIKLVTNENNGFGQAANLGAKLADTKYIFFCSPDNYVEEKSIEKLEKISEELNDKFSMLILSDLNDPIASKKLVNETQGVFCFFTKKKDFFDIKGFDENFFLYYEDVDLIKRALKIKMKLYQVPIRYSNFLGSHNKKYNHAIEVNRNWHFMWSKFFYYKKHKGYFFALINTLPFLIRSTFRLIINLNKPAKKEIYFARISGLYNSYILKQPWFRPKI